MELPDRPDFSTAGSEPPVQNKRAGERSCVNLQCDIRVGTRNWYRAHLRDLTASGFRVKLSEMPRDGTPVRIRMSGLAPLEAEVCWSKDFQAGCKFSQPLSSYVFEHIVRQAQAG